MSGPSRRPSYGIFVRFRRSRLALRRGIVRLEEALALAEQLRASRFHDRGDIFVVKEPEGTIIELGPERPLSQPPAAPAAPPPPEPEPEIRAKPGSDAGTGSEPPPSPPVRDVAALLVLFARADHAHRAVDHARAALVRFERAFSAAEQVIAVRRVEPPPELRRNQERLGAVRASAALTVESFERVAAMMERRLEVALGDATARSRPI